MYLQRIRWQQYKKQFLYQNKFRSDLTPNKDVKFFKPSKFTAPKTRLPSDVIGYLNVQELDDPFIRKIAEVTTIKKK